jgi:ankyrin repeat protein
LGLKSSLSASTGLGEKIPELKSRKKVVIPEEQPRIKDSRKNNPGEMPRSYYLYHSFHFSSNFSGANINQQDKYGRAPLHVAAAVDYTEMIEFLLNNNADMEITTFGELQTPVHFAAKNDACQALKLLRNYGANINGRDYQNRTPIQVRSFCFIIIHSR